MNAMRTLSLSLLLVGLVFASTPTIRGDVQAQEKPKVALPQAGVPEVITMEGKFVRAAYNNEGYVIIGYQLANRSIGEEWMLLEVGLTVRDGVKEYTLRRDALSIETPDGVTHPLPSIGEFRKANTAALQARERVQRDSINYFPPSASRACGIVFFPDVADRAMPRDEIEVNPSRACLGRLFFHVPGGIKHGQHWLNVKFDKSLVRVPFRILTADEEKLLSKNYKDIKKQLEDAFKKK